MSDETLSDNTMSDVPNPQAPPPSDLSQAEAIAILQQSIRQLTQLLAQVNQVAAPLPSKETLENLAHTTQLLTQDLSISPESTLLGLGSIPGKSLGDPRLTETSPEEPEELDESPTGLDQVLPDLDHLDNWWDRFLVKIRSVLPRALDEKLSDWALTSILAGLLVVSLVSSVLLLPRIPSEMKELPPLAQPQPSPDTLPPAEPELEPSASLANPPELLAPDEPEPIPVDPVPPKYTPEQSLVAAIQQEISTLTQSYASGLILSVNADFLASHLILTVNDDWYALKPNRQESLGNEVWLRSQKLNFRKLEILDSQGQLVARNPVVGNAIVILR
jgi:hypothetical protein